jgi:hypothetical protein
VGADGNLRVSLLAGLAIEREGKMLHLANMYVVHESGKATESSNHTIASFVRHHGRRHGAYEVAVGKDPAASALWHRMGEHRRVLFAGFRTMQAFTFKRDTGRIRALQPVTGAVFLLPHLRLPARGRLQVVPGMNVWFDDKGRIRWMTNMEVECVINHPDLRLIATRSYTLLTQIQLAW